MNPSQQMNFAADESQSSIQFVDFLKAWWRWRWWYVVGLLLVGMCTFATVKLFMTKYYKSQVTFFVGERFTPESLVGIAEAKVFKGGLNQQFLAAVSSLLASEYMKSDDLLLEVCDSMAKPSADGQPGVDMMELLDIRDKPVETASQRLAYMLSNSLVETQRLENSGVMVFSVEMPDPDVAARFANEAVQILQERFTTMTFEYFECALKLYEEQMRDEIALRDKISNELVAIQYDRFPKVEQRRKGLEEQLDQQAEKMGELNIKIQDLRLAVAPEAKLAAQPVKVIEKARAPFKKSRPKTIVTTFLAMMTFTFFFVVGLVIQGALQYLLSLKQTEKQ